MWIMQFILLTSSIIIGISLENSKENKLQVMPIGQLIRPACSYYTVERLVDWINFIPNLIPC